MRSIAALLLVIVGLAVGLGACVARGRPLPADGLVNLVPGQTITLTLEANPSTGYAWSVECDGTVVELIRQEYESRSNLPGAPGVESFTFRGVAPGRVDVAFNYRRNWEQEAIKTEVVSFVVR
ncbi:MAG: protease inhibitor I42 family protein [bacterium]|nr:protease inhibitor I42 family protein [bacterium]